MCAGCTAHDPGDEARHALDGAYRRYLAALRERLARARGETLARLRPLGLTPWIEPAAGIFLWMRLPDGLDAGAVAQHALAHGVVLAPGVAFSASRGWRDHLRFNAAQSGDRRIYEVLDLAMRSARGSPPMATPPPLG